MELLSLILRRITGLFRSLASKLAAKLAKIKAQPKKIAKKAGAELREIAVSVFKKPSELSDYIRLGGSYVAKRSLLWGTLVLAALVFLIVWVAVPFVRKTFFTQKLKVNTAEFFAATGRAEVYAPDDTLLYIGDVDNGVITGNGRVYRGGVEIYSGGFADNEYNGTGKLFDENGDLVYSGEFTDSRFSGEGSLYYPGGALKISGTFSQDLPDGRASVFLEDGRPLYVGDFTAGRYNGAGELYDDGELVYSGDFVNGERSGNGTEFKDGEKIYSGGFVNGKYSGEGVLYRSRGGRRIEGTFENGKANGNGTVYDVNGEQLFSGVISDNEISYPSYISSDKEAVEESFTANADTKQIDGSELIYYPQLGAGFVFGADGKTDRIIITGSDRVYGAENGISPESFVPPEGAVKYSSYRYKPTQTDKKLMIYIGVPEHEKMSCDKYIFDNIFIKLYYDEGEVLFYELGTV